jgi:hypothetical protein
MLPNNTFGYPAYNEPCRVCGKFDNNQCEPRFLYVVCEEHQSVLPVNIPPKPEQPEQGAPKLKDRPYG